MESDFHGAKAALFIGADLLVYQRDKHVRWPGYWDFPGGGREGRESPFDCLRREVFEEFGLTVTPEQVVWKKHYPAMAAPIGVAWFFVLRMPSEAARDIRFGDEGQRWALMSPLDVAQLPNLVPALRDRLRLWLRETGGDPI